MNFKDILNTKLIKTIIAGIVIVVIVVYGVIPINNAFNERDELRVENRKFLISQDSLQKTNDGQYTKLINNTLTITELQEIVKDLEGKPPQLVEVIKYKLKEDTKQEIDSVSIKDSTVYIKDFYPDKKDWYISYQAHVNLHDSTKTKGYFEFQPLEIQLAITAEENGLYRTHLKAPSFIEITDLEISTLPTTFTPVKKDNFGWLLGAGINKNLTTNTKNIEVLGGFRYKKIQVLGSISSENYVGIKTIIEF